MRAKLFWTLIFLSVPIIWRNPAWGITLYSVLNLVRPEMFFWGGNTGAQSLFFIFAVTFTSIIFNYRKLPVKSFMTRETFLLLWLYMAILLSILLSEYKPHRVYYYAHEIGKLFLFCCLMVLVVDNKEKLLRYENVMLFALLFLGLWGIDQHFRGNERLEGLGGNAFPDTNGIAALFVLYFPVALSKAVQEKVNRKKLFWFAATIVLILLIVFTQSRGGFLGLMVGAGIIILKSPQRIKIFGYGLILFFLVQPFLSEGYLTRLGTIALSEDESFESSANSRLYLWQAGLMVFADNPIIGTGFMSYPKAKMKYEYRFQHLDPEFRAFIFREKNKKVTHNTYIRLLADGGIITAIPFYLLLFGTFWQNYKVRKVYYANQGDDDLFNLLQSIEAGIWGYSVCIFFIDSIGFVFLPWQIVVSATIRRLLYENMAVSALEPVTITNNK